MVALRPALGGGSDLVLEYLSRSGRSFLDDSSETPVENDLEPPAGLAVEERASRDLGSQHLFQANGLSTELGFVSAIGLRPTPLVFDREWPPPPRPIADFHAARVCTELHYIRLAHQPEVERAQRQSACNSNSSAPLPHVRVNTLVQLPPLGR